MDPRPRHGRELFGRLPDGHPVALHTLRNRDGLRLRFLDYGGIVVSLCTPDRTGGLGDVVLGFDELAPYLDRSPYFGAIVGRYANRIANGRFTLDGVPHQLHLREAPHHRHGAGRGWDRVLWTTAPFEQDDRAGVHMTYTSADGEDGFPGTVKAEVTYTLTDGNAWIFECRATCDRPTVLNVTQHTYFNLSSGDDVLGHEVTIHADAFTPVDPTLVPTGTFAPVAGTPFDFRHPMPIGARIDATHEQLRYGRGYDHNFVLRNGSAAAADRAGSAQGESRCRPAAHVVEPVSGRTLDVETSQPGLQFYTGNNLRHLPGKGGRVYAPRAGFCLETQHFPDSPNHPKFPSTVLRPGETFREVTVYRFGTDDR
jgi:aldose 1-epimerase